MKEASDLGQWQAMIYRPYRAPARTIEEVRKAVPASWEVIVAEDAEAGIWLVTPSSRVRRRLEDGAEYRWTNPRTGWAIEISQP